MCSKKEKNFMAIDLNNWTVVRDYLGRAISISFFMQDVFNMKAFHSGSTYDKERYNLLELIDKINKEYIK